MSHARVGRSHFELRHALDRRTAMSRSDVEFGHNSSQRLQLRNIHVSYVV